MKLYLFLGFTFMIMIMTFNRLINKIKGPSSSSIYIYYCKTRNVGYIWRFSKYHNLAKI